MENELYTSIEYLLITLSKSQKGLYIESSLPNTIGINTVNIMLEYRLITARGDIKDGCTVDITQTGIMALSYGVKKYLTEKRQREIDTEIFEFEKLKYDVSNSRRIFKTYWVTFALAVLGFIISLVLLVLKLEEPTAPTSQPLLSTAKQIHEKK